jgi:cytochrome c oxidase assembly protein subunit 15
VIVLTILTAVSAYRGVRRSDPPRWRMALAIGLGTLAQGPLGGITILTGLHPVVVMSHFLLALVIFSVATVLLVDVRGGTPAAVSRPPWLPPATIAFALWAILLIVSGAVVTMSGTHPGADDVPRLWNLLDAAYWHVRIAVSFVFALAGFLFLIARLELTGGRVPRVAWAVVALVAAQILIGEWQWRHQLPWWTVLMHVATAAALWSAVIALARSLLPRRP